ncbi:hypothetical protein CBR_g39449 [Chara braunii]|uniref:Myb-like domain-containing protein n=1 Tax=Chara braunii TaxID=69332 RepID=A0A388LRV6_CHABU|nr:hypothetical protein CBR_g39449 [Chara braunii]|eukprot:GBG84985.1 hypothetical protein CBR_g39449 [Chara braunii]
MERDRVADLPNSPGRDVPPTMRTAAAPSGARERRTVTDTSSRQAPPAQQRQPTAAEDQVRASVEKCYDDGICPDGLELGEVVEDEQGRHLVVYEAADDIKESWLKERTVIVIFQEGAKQLSRQVKEDLIRAQEDGWISQRISNPELGRGRIRFEGQNVISYVAKAKEVAEWLLRKKKEKLKLGAKEYLTTFKPWMPKQELRMLKLQEAETSLGITALRVPLDAYYYLRDAARGMFGEMEVLLNRIRRHPLIHDLRLHGENECRALNQGGTETITRGVQRLHVDEGDEAAFDEPLGCDDVDGDDDCNSDDLPKIRQLGRKVTNGGASAKRGPALKNRRNKNMDDDTGRSDGEGGRNFWSTMGITREGIDCEKKWDNLMQQFKKVHKFRNLSGGKDYFKLASKARQSEGFNFVIDRSVYDETEAMMKGDHTIHPKNLADMGAAGVVQMLARAGAGGETMVNEGGGEAADEEQGSTKDSTFSARSGDGYGKRKNMRQQTFEAVVDIMDKHGALMASTMDSTSK